MLEVLYIDRETRKPIILKQDVNMEFSKALEIAKEHNSNKDNNTVISYIKGMKNDILWTEYLDIKSNKLVKPCRIQPQHIDTNSRFIPELHAIPEVIEETWFPNMWVK
tara:strand:+ start:1160 stop:1483 length:324 start_codon:yes stop_codon:yes gene_type:complete